MDGENGRGLGTLMYAVGMQYFCMKTAQDVANKAMDMVGGEDLANGRPLVRYYREVRDGSRHLSEGDALELICKHAFGLPHDVEPGISRGKE